MKKWVHCALVLLVAFVIIGCGSSPKAPVAAPAGPELGEPTALQEALNLLDPVTVAGNELKFEFGGDVWIATVDGANFMAGTCETEETEEGSTLTLKQTHLYSAEQKPVVGGDIGWVKTPGPDIVLEYIAGPPEALSVK
ncbi:MAG: hypothetical protein FWD36_06535 [Treponema sp.]|nr:hypothetical protein [Treponema sp.]